MAKEVLNGEALPRPRKDSRQVRGGERLCPKPKARLRNVCPLRRQSNLPMHQLGWGFVGSKSCTEYLTLAVSNLQDGSYLLLFPFYK